MSRSTKKPSRIAEEALQLNLTDFTVSYLQQACEQVRSADAAAIPGGTASQELQDLDRITELAKRASVALAALIAQQVRLNDGRFRTVLGVPWLLRDQHVAWEALPDDFVDPITRLQQTRQIVDAVVERSQHEAADRRVRGQAGGAPQKALPALLVRAVAYAARYSDIQPSASTTSRFMQLCEACFQEAGLKSPEHHVRVFLRDVQALLIAEGGCLPALEETHHEKKT